MSKTVRRIISSLLVVAAFATAEPANFINLLSQKAYASDTWNSSDYALLDDVDMDEGSISSYSDTKSSIKGKVKSSVDEVKITARAKDSSYKVTIDGDESDTGECEKTVDLDKGKNTIKIKVEDPSGKKDSATYYAYITRGSSSSDDDDDDDDDNDSNAYLYDLSVSDHDFAFSSLKDTYNIEVGESESEIRIKAEPEDDDDTVEIDGETVDDGDNYKRTVSLNEGKNVIKVKVKDDDDDNDRTYTLNVYRGVKAPSEDETVGVGQEDNTQDSIYLDKLKLVDYNYNLNFKRKVTAYEVNVPEDYDSILVKAEPDDSGDNVRVNDGEVDNNYNRSVPLQEGKNIIKVKVYNNEDKNDDDYEERTYTITVNRGGTGSGNSSSTNSNTANNTSNSAGNTSGTNNAVNSSVKINQWVKNSAGQWNYNDGLGKPLINTWYFDKNYGKWYHFGFDGSMNTGWQYDNGKTYYLNEDGSMQIGWKYLGSFWYYFNSDGNMRTGWLQNSDGKWYYFYPGGGMASNVKIDGYTLGSDGAML